MPIRGYFEPRPVGALRTTLQGGLGGGIAVQGPVLEGRMSVEEAVLLNRIRGCDRPQLVGDGSLQRDSSGVKPAEVLPLPPRWRAISARILGY